MLTCIQHRNKKRLLHPGADTKDILTQYVSIIRCLRMIDPPGVLLYKVADPIRKYLRERPDTIRCIVASLVGDGESGDSLVDENEPIQPLQQRQADDFVDPNWEPEPIDAGPGMSNVGKYRSLRRLNDLEQISVPTSQQTSSALSSVYTTQRIFSSRSSRSSLPSASWLSRMGTTNERCVAIYPGEKLGC